MLEEKQSLPAERGSKSFKKQFEALFDKTFNIYIEKLFFLQRFALAVLNGGEGTRRR